MFRIPKCLWTARPLLRYRYLKIQLTGISRCATPQYKVQVREPCPPKPLPPPEKPKDDSAFWATMAVAMFAAGFAVIAKHSPEIRDWLTIYAPWFDDIIAIAFEENMTYREFTQKCIEDLKGYMKLIMKDEPCSPEDKAKPNIILEQAETEKPCEKPPPIVVRKTVCEIIERLKDRSNEALSNYYTANRACLLYNQIVADSMQNFSIPTLKELHGHLTERLHLVNESIKSAEEATDDIEDLTQYLECGVQGPEDEVGNTKVLMKDYLNQIKTAQIKYTWENDKSTVLDSQWQKVEFVINKYVDENETMFPEIKYDQTRLQLNGDPDFLLYHTNRYSRKLKMELNDAADSMMRRVNRAFETLPQGAKEAKQRDATLQAVLTRKRAEMDREFQKRYNDQRMTNEKILKDSFKKQLERHEETMEKRLQDTEKKATIKLNNLVAKRVAHEKEQFAKQLNELALKLAIVESKLNARLKAERETRRSQELWVAGASLLAATKKGEAYVDVTKELKAIEKVSGDGDKLVSTVLKAIPESVRDDGLVPESVLRARYHQMEKVALKVALVDQEGAPLPVYMLSWLQSALLFMKLSGIPQSEIDKPALEPLKDLDTFDLLQRARFWVERGNLAAAIQYVSSLEGASRVAAASWYDSARSHVETRQAAEAILAHAAALGLQYT